MFSRAELEAAWAGLLSHDRCGEAPDVLGWRDLHAAALRGEAAPPLPVSAYRVPKRSGPPATRRLDVLDGADHAAYRALVARLAATIEPRLGPGVTAYRTLRRSRGLLVEPWKRARRRHRLLLRRLLASRPGAVVVADVRDCFARMRPEAVERAVARLGAHPAAVAALRRLLRRFAVDGVHGLPVGPEPSGVLANAVLAAADLAVAARGGRHVRWVDDFAIAVRDRAAAANVLEALRSELADLELEVAEEKCGIVEGDGLRALQHEMDARSSGGGPDLRSRPVWAPASAFMELEAAQRSLPDHEALERLRAVAARRWGSAEAAVLSYLADDPARSAPVRAWAWRALARTDPERCLGRAAEVADEPDPWVQRAVVAAVGLAGGVRARRLLRTVRARTSQVAATAAWGLER